MRIGRNPFGRDFSIGSESVNRRPFKVSCGALVALGVVVGGMVVAMYLPIFDMINAVQ